MQTQINGLTIEYEREGTGKPVLLLHGWGACIDAMRPIANHLVKIGREAVTLDFPGFGKSDAPQTPWRVSDYASLTRAFIEKMGIEGCDLVCHSFGGRVTIQLAAADKNLFGKLILVDAAGVRPRRGLKYYIKIYSYKLVKKLSRVPFLSTLFGLEKRMQKAGSSDYRSLSGAMRGTFVNVVNEDLTHLLSQIENETLLIWGENDQDTPLYMAKIMEKKIKRAGLAVIPGAGHFSYIDDYPRFCSILDVLLKEDCGA